MKSSEGIDSNEVYSFKLKAFKILVISNGNLPKIHHTIVGYRKHTELSKHSSFMDKSRSFPRS